MNVNNINDFLGLDCVQELLTKVGMTTEIFRDQLTAEIPEPTPGAQWIVNGEPDPFAGRYNCTRDELPMGEVSDYSLANLCFLNYDRVPSMPDLLSGKGKMPIVYMTAMKERMRWLSFQLSVLQGQAKLEKI